MKKSKKNILSEAGEVQFRSFSQDDPIQGEIKGKFASHGKVGNGPINSILLKLKLPQLTKRNNIFSMINKAETAPLKKYAKIISTIIANAKIVDINVARDAEVLFKKKMLEMDPTQVVSKFQAVELMAIVKRARQDKRDSFVQELLGFASSRTQLSSVFVKVM